MRPIHDGLYQILMVKLVTGGETLVDLAKKGYITKEHADKYVVTQKGLAHLNECTNLHDKLPENNDTKDTLPGLQV